MKQIPNLFTLLNLLFGCFAIVVILQNGIAIQNTVEGTQLIDIPEKIWMASFFIGLAALVDFLDGFVARLFNAQSEIGKQLDSLADVVSFGVAPSMILYQFLRMSFAKEENGIEVSFVYLVPAFFVAAAAAYRLAKFNIDEHQQYGFKGVPTPAVGLLIASLPIIYWQEENVFVIDALLNKWVLYGMILLLCYLMTSNIPMMSLKMKSKLIKDNIPKLILVAFSMVATFIFHSLAVPIIFFAYIILSLIFKKN